MTRQKLLSVHLEGDMLTTARKGSFNFMNRLRNCVEAAGWKLRFRPVTGKQGDISLWHMRAPDDVAERGDSLVFRRSYHYPFWYIDPQPERWRWPVAEAAFEAPDRKKARDFAARLRSRTWPETEPQQGSEVLVPLQGHIRRCRSFQTMAPVEMVEAVGRSGLPACITLHPREEYNSADRQALDDIIARHENLRLGENSRKLLPDCAGVVTMNSAVGFDALILGKPLALFGQIDFHHIALKAAELGAERALALLPDYQPDYAGYLHWFLGQSIDAMAPDAEVQIRNVLAQCGLEGFAAADGYA